MRGFSSPAMPSAAFENVHIIENIQAPTPKKSEFRLGT
jgi:hypothetical protein